MKRTLSRLETLLLTASDDLRGSVDASEYKGIHLRYAFLES
jgi:hypothetical protein